MVYNKSFDIFLVGFIMYVDVIHMPAITKDRERSVARVPHFCIKQCINFKYTVRRMYIVILRATNKKINAKRYS